MVPNTNQHNLINPYADNTLTSSILKIACIFNTPAIINDFKNLKGMIKSIKAL